MEQMIPQTAEEQPAVKKAPRQPRVLSPRRQLARDMVDRLVSCAQNQGTALTFVEIYLEGEKVLGTRIMSRVMTKVSETLYAEKAAEVISEGNDV